jgi:hypothetical protein
LLHAEADARRREHRASLRSAARSFDRVSRQRGHDPDQALQAWRALVAGRWSLIQSFESDGRRYLIARRNQPGRPPGQALTALEAAALLSRARAGAYKLLEYELGISASAAHRLVRSGMAKLGIRSESELPRLLRAQLEQQLTRDSR